MMAGTPEAFPLYLRSGQRLRGPGSAGRSNLYLNWIILMPEKYEPLALRSPPFMESSSIFLPNSVSPCDDDIFESGRYL
jgi:hypothetical protein